MVDFTEWAAGEERSTERDSSGHCQGFSSLELSAVLSTIHSILFKKVEAGLENHPK